MLPDRATTTYQLFSPNLNVWDSPPEEGSLEHQASQLIRSGTKEAFQAFVERTSLDVTALRLEDGQNGLHLAIRSKNDDIALYLLEPGRGWARALANARDNAGQTPLMYAAHDPHHTPVSVVDALALAATAEELCATLARSIMQFGPSPLSDRLTMNTAHAVVALALILEREDLSTGSARQAVNYLKGQGADLERALWRAAQQGWSRAIQLLIFLACNWSAQLMSVAAQNDVRAVRHLLQSGADTSRALMHFAISLRRTDRDPRHNTLDAASVALIIKMRHELGVAPTSEKEALLKLAKCSDLIPMQRLSQMVRCGPLSLREIARCSVEAIRILIAARLVPEGALEQLVRAGDLVQARKLVVAGVETGELLHRLELENAIHRVCPQYSASPTALRILLAVGANPEGMHPDVLVEVDRHFQQVRNLPPHEVAEQLEVAARQGRADEICLLISQPENAPAVLAVMRKLIAEGQVHAAAMFIKSGLNACEMLWAAMDADVPDLDTARALIAAADALRYPDEAVANPQSSDVGRHSLATIVLIDVLKDGRWDLASRFISHLTNGAWAAVECVSVGTQESLALFSWLRSSGADLCSAWFIAFKTKRYEAAARLITWEPGIVHQAQVRTFLELTDPRVRALAQNALLLNGADYPSALLEAAKADQPEAAKRLLHQYPTVGAHAVLKLSEQTPTETNVKMLRFLLRIGVDIRAVEDELACDPYNLSNSAKLANLRALRKAAALYGWDVNPL